MNPAIEQPREESRHLVVILLLLWFDPRRGVSKKYSLKKYSLKNGINFLENLTHQSHWTIIGTYREAHHST